MSLNYKEINTILEELDLQGSSIQQIVQPSFDSIALYLYKSSGAKTIFICTASGACRIHQTNQKIPKTDKPLRFMQFLRSHIKGSRITDCVQLGNERIIRLKLSRSTEEESKKFLCYIRLWSGAANIIVTDEDNLILEAFYRRPKRGEIRGKIFSAPKTTTTSEKEWHVRDFSEINSSVPLSFNQKVDLWYAEHAQNLSREALLEQAEKLFTIKKHRMEGALNRLKAKKENFLLADKYRHYGDLILTYGNLVLEASSNDEKAIDCIDYETETPIRIEIDPKKNVQENAQSYYTTYKKAVSGLEDLESDIRILHSNLAKLIADYDDLQNEENPLEIKKRLHKQTTPKQHIEKEHPGLRYIIDGWTLYVGRSASENDALLRHYVKGQDWWLHVRDWHGGYIFIKNQRGKSIPLDILLDAGNLAVFYSKARKAGSAELYYTQVKHLRRAKNAPKGTVLPSNEKNLSITLDTDRLKRIELITKEVIIV
ncbi:MAG: NFACT RNA binding domain-containing protein [Treponemataceae bacterium]